MGIGLFISRSIIERHQGRLWAEGNDGPGATFAFSIPRMTDFGRARHTDDPPNRGALHLDSGKGIV
jgi:signal transduction histidine kinase